MYNIFLNWGLLSLHDVLFRYNFNSPNPCIVTELLNTIEGSYTYWSPQELRSEAMGLKCHSNLSLSSAMAGAVSGDDCNLLQFLLIWLLSWFWMNLKGHEKFCIWCGIQLNGDLWQKRLTNATWILSSITVLC